MLLTLLILALSQIVSAQKPSLLGISICNDNDCHAKSEGDLSTALVSALSGFESVGDYKAIFAPPTSSINILHDDRVLLSERIKIAGNERRTHGDLVDVVQVAQYIAHVDAWKALVDSEYDYAIILDGLSSFPSDIAQRLEESLEDELSRPDQWDFLLLGFGMYPTVTHPISATTLSSNAGEYVIPERWRGLNAYVITREGAKKLLPTALPMASRIEYHLSSMAYLGHLTALMPVDESLHVYPDVAMDELPCDLCDLPLDYSRARHVGWFATFGAVLGFVVAFFCVRFTYDLIEEMIACMFSKAPGFLRDVFSHKGALFCLLLVSLVLGAIQSYPPVIAPTPRIYQPDITEVTLHGSTHDSWHSFTETVKDSNVYHATVATYILDTLGFLSQTAEWHGDSISILGMDDPRFRQWGHGFGVKLELFQQFVESKDEDDLILFTDAFDVLMVESHEKIRDRFIEVSKLTMARESDPAVTHEMREQGVVDRPVTIVFSTELFCHPDPHRWSEYPEIDRMYYLPYLNSGTFVGKAGDLKRIMALYPYSISDDDQRYWTTLYLESRRHYDLPRIGLDHDNDIFLCMSGHTMYKGLQFDPSTQQYKFIHTPGQPLIMHFNNAKTEIHSFYKALQMKWSPYFVLPHFTKAFITVVAFFALWVGIVVGRYYSFFFASTYVALPGTHTHKRFGFC